MDDLLGTNGAVFPSNYFATSEAPADKALCQLPDGMLSRANPRSVDQEETHTQALAYDSGMDLLDRCFF
jgi:hypothetical protein